MRSGRRRFVRGESGSELVEWIVVTLILTLAIFVMLQIVGGRIEQMIENVKAFFQF